MNINEEKGESVFRLKHVSTQWVSHLWLKCNICASLLSRCQLKCEKLEGEKTELTTRFSVRENEKKDIVEYLKRTLLEKEEEVDELTERLESQQQAADADRDARQLLHNGLIQELQNQVTELTTENGTLGKKCNTVFVCLPAFLLYKCNWALCQYYFCHPIILSIRCCIGV